VPGFISDADIQRVREATDIVALVGEYVPLKRTGTSFKALCPFHQEKTPSFSVVPAKQIFKCFGCGAAGDVFSFVMKREGLEFADAVRALAQRAGIALTEAPGDRRRRTSRQRICDANRWAADYFAECLNSPQGAPVREYLERRGIRSETVRRFGLGYALPAWDDLVRHARTRHADLAVLEEAGLVRRRRDGGGHVDLFRHRLMFPIVDPRGRVLGFGGRTLDDTEPKYLNSPETPVFNKGRALYGLDQAARAMQQEGRAVVVEGYTDVLMAHQHGVADAVAVLGTALTEDHVRLLKRFARRAVLVLDADSAGRASAERSLNAFARAGMEVAVGRLPEGSDPCAFLAREGREAFEAVLANGQRPLAFKLERLRAETGGRWEVAGTLDPVLEMVSLIEDPVSREMTLNELAGETGVSPVTLQLRLRQLGRAPTRRAAGAPATVRRDPERELLAALLTAPGCAEAVRDALDPAWIQDAAVGRLVARALEVFAAEGAVDAPALLARTSDPVERAVVEDLMGGTAPVAEPLRWCRQLLARLRALHAERSARVLDQRLRTVSAPEEKARLLEELARLRRQADRRIGFGKDLVARSRR